MQNIDLFGTAIELPRRIKSSTNLGTTQFVDQKVLCEPTPPSLLPIEPRRDNEDTLDDDDNLPEPNLSPRDALKRYLQQNSIAFVDADKVKAGLFSRDRLELFDFVVHREDTTYLVAACAKRPHTSLLSDLKQWEKILGPGFQAAVAVIDEDDPISFRTVDGDKLDIV
jgi:hypothetical protein